MVKFKSSKATSILLSLGVVLGLVAIVFSQVLQYRNQEIKIEEIKAGDLQEGSVTYDKLAEDVFTTVELEFENGVKGVAKVVNGRVENGILGGQLQFETVNGEIITGEVIGSIPVEVADGSITEEKLSKVLINRIEKLEDEQESNNVEEEEESESEEVIEEDESDDDDVYEIEDGSIVTVKLANSAVTTSKLADGSITTVKISDASITSGKIQDATILERDLANGSITSIKIEDGAITTSKLLDNSVTTAKITDGTILNNDISNTAGIVYSKLNLTGSLQFSDIGQNGCTDGQIMKWSSIESKWVCAEDTDTDTDTHLSESEVEEYITDEAIGLSIGSMIGSELIATQDWVEDKEYITDGNTNWDNTYGFITASSMDTLSNKFIDGDDNTIIDLTVTSLKSGVLDTNLESVSLEDNTVASAKAVKEAIKSIYPVGSIYINASDSTNPSELFGFGTWIEFGQGEVMVGLNPGDADFDTAGETGGEKKHTLTAAEMPTHSHYIYANIGSVPNVYADYGRRVDLGDSDNQSVRTYWAKSGTATRAHSGETGGNQSHNNLQPYITVYMWVRTE